MSLGTFFRQTGISVLPFDPIIDPSAGSYTTRGFPVERNMVSRIDGYSHELANEWGYKSISISLGGSQPYLDEWFDNGLGRHIEVYNAANQIIHAGFVNRITLTSNTLQASNGPILDICNRASVVYTPITDVSVSPPLTGAEKSTVIAEDDESQLRYGIIEKVLSGGQLLDDGTTDEAEDYRDRYLEEMKQPNMSDKGLSLGGQNNPSLQLEIMGYYAWLGLYIYTSIATGTTTVTAKMQTILGADPNAIISTDYNEVEDNNLLTQNYDNDNRTAKTIIEEMIKRGNDVDDQRRIFGIFANQQVIYNTIPSLYKYYYKISSRDQIIRDYNSGETGKIIQPWDVMPGQWLFIGDFLIGRRSDASEKSEDPRSMFIESVVFTAPNGLSLNGIGVSELPQYLAKLGVS